MYKQFFLAIYSIKFFLWTMHEQVVRTTTTTKEIEKDDNNIDEKKKLNNYPIRGRESGDAGGEVDDKPAGEIDDPGLGEEPLGTPHAERPYSIRKG